MRVDRWLPWYGDVHVTYALILVVRRENAETEISRLQWRWNNTKTYFKLLSIDAKSVIIINVKWSTVISL